MTVPDAVMASAPITERAWITHRWPMMARGPTTEPSTEADAATRAPGSRTESTTEAPSSTTAPAPITDPATEAPAATDEPCPRSERLTVAPAASTSPILHTPGPTSGEATAPGEGGPGRRPRRRSAWARR